MDTQNKLSFSIFKNKKYFSLLIVAIFVFLYFLISAPFSSGPIAIHVTSGESLRDISTDLKNKDVIRSETVFKVFVNLFGSDKQIPFGDYFFEKNFTVIKVASMLSYGNHNISPIKIIIREGATNEQIAQVLSLNKPNFNSGDFLQKTANKRGYLYPDTYFIFPLATNSEIINMLEGNFNRHTATLKSDILKSNHSLRDIITMASIIQKEASGLIDGPVISGILWKRIKLKMPLQVDADSDTYKTLGLPSMPISNPSIDAIRSAIFPADSDYLYYLHDHSGVVHYAKTFAEHKKNISLYLK